MTKRSYRPRRVGLGLGLACWLGIACGAVQAWGSDAIPWRTDLGRAAIEARSQDRLLWVQFTGSWCPNCVRLERESFVHPKIVGHALNAFVPVKLQSEDHEDLVDRYGVTGIPATILIAPSGAVVGRHEGYVDAATFHAFLERALIRTGRTTATAPATAPPGRAAGPRLALDGYCPVSMVTAHRLVPGQPALSLRHDGQVYRFADERMRQAFLRQPERFLPVIGGRCPVAQVDRGESRPGTPRWSVLFRDHLFLCATEDGRARFLKDPERYAHVALADRPTGGRPGPSDNASLEARRPGPEALRR